MKIKTTIKFITLTAVFACIFSCNSKENIDRRNNETACKKFEQMLSILDSNKNAYVRVGTNAFDTVIEMESISGIRGDGPFVSWIGDLYISDEDIRKWADWYRENKQYLRWNDLTSSLYLIKKTK